MTEGPERLTITEQSCRLCLKNCSELDSNISLQVVEHYQELTGYTIQSTEIPKKICAICEGLIDSFIRFRRKSIEVESRLTQFMVENEPNVKYEEDISDMPLVSRKKQLKIKRTPIAQRFPKEELMAILNLSSERAKTKETEASLHCSKCHQTFRTINQRTLHYKTVHPGPNEFYCDLCSGERPYQTKDSLKNHMKFTHFEKIPCDDCGKLFGPLKLDLHRKRVHSTEISMICHFCGKGFALKAKLKEHYLYYHSTAEEWGFGCERCGKRFKNSQALKRHSSIHTPDQYACKTCGKSFGTHRYLRIHQNVHTKEGYDCPLCPSKRFSASQTLKAHIIAHHPQIRLPPIGTTLKNFDWRSVLPPM